jgi:hypothetical protein
MFMAGLRGPGVDRDYLSYQLNFELITEIAFPQNLLLMEPSFVTLVTVIRELFQTAYSSVIFFIIAVLAVGLKMKSIKNLGINPYMCVLLYYSHFFLLHEMTQIRIGAASAIFLYAIPSLLNKEKTKYILLIVLAATFHISALLFLLFMLFDTTTFNQTKYFLLLCIAFILAYIKLPFLEFLNIFEGIGLKYDSYVETVEKGEATQINILNATYVMSIFFCILIGLFVEKSKLLEDKLSLISLKSTFISFFVLCLLSGVPTVSFRVSEIFGLFTMFLFVSTLKYFPQKKVFIILLVSCAAILFYINLFHGEGLLKAYRMINI